NLQRINQPRARVGSHDQSVYEHKRIVKVRIAVAVGRGEFDDAPVFVEPREAALHQAHQVRLDARLLADGGVAPGALLLLAVAVGAGFRLFHSRSGREEQVKARAFGERQHFVGNRFGRIAVHLLAAIGAEGATDARVEQTQVVVDFRLRGDGRARVARRVFLANRDGRADADDFVNVGLVHAFEELPRVGRQALDVTPLAFGVDGVKGE